MTSDDIFEAYISDKCPVCGGANVTDKGNISSGGKTMAYYMMCIECHSEYTVGFMRSRMSIKSEITYNGLMK